jgi:peptide/nickel transport system permease protein
MVALGALLVLVAVGLFAGVFSPYAENALDLAHVNMPRGPTLAGSHFFGTDYLGRDVFSQTLYGLHTSVLVALAVGAFATAVGVLVGAIAGYAGGVVELVLMRGVELIVAVPLLAVMLASLVFFSSLTPTRFGIVLGLYAWTGVARVVCAACAALRGREFVEAARAAAASPLRIVVRHLLPNCSGTILVAATSVFGLAVTAEATIDFFNVGTAQVSQGGPTLGNLISDATKFGPLSTQPWWTWAPPAAVLVLLLTCANFVGDALDDALTAPRST